MLDKTLQRVKNEKSELDVKLKALRSFLNTETCNHLPETSSDLLRAQYVVMNRYSEILGMRIKEFK